MDSREAERVGVADVIVLNVVEETPAEDIVIVVRVLSLFHVECSVFGVDIPLDLEDACVLSIVDNF